MLIAKFFRIREKNMKLYTLLLAMLTFTSTAAMADGLVHLTNRFGFGVDGGLAVPVLDRSFRDAVGTGYDVGAHIDYNFTDAVGIEAEYQHLVYKTGNPITNGYTVNLNYRLLPSAAITPVLGIGGGWGSTTGIAALENTYDNFMADGKFAIDFRLTDEWMFEAAVKYDWLFSKYAGEHDQETMVPAIAFTYYPGHSEDRDMTNKEAMEKEKAHDRDLQNQANAANSDAANARAQAAAAAAAAAASADSATRDDDGDGVPNSIDKCPNTPPGTKVNSIGCPIEEKVDYTIDVQFRTGKSTFSTEYNTELDKMVDLLKEHTDLKAEIQGYTDSVGGAAKNKALSQQRAHAVQKYIVMHGVKASRVTYKGYGIENPVADNTTAEGRKQNRRVVASVATMGATSSSGSSGRHTHGSSENTGSDSSGSSNNQ
jgi:OOP family OmpA-OmpF porin